MQGKMLHRRIEISDSGSVCASHIFSGTVFINCNPLISDIVVVSYQKIVNINL